MTTAEKTNIENLFSNITQMKKVADNFKTPYFDEKIAEKAQKAIDNAQQTSDAICAEISKHLSVFFDFSRPIPLSTSHYSSEYWVNLRDKQKVGFHFGDFVATIVVEPADIKDFQVGCYEASFRTKPEAMKVFSVRPDIPSSADNPLYNTLRAEDLFFLQRDHFDLKATHTAAQWNYINKLADATNAKTPLLVRAFEKYLTAKAEAIKKEADKNEQYFKANEQIA